MGAMLGPSSTKKTNQRSTGNLLRGNITARD